MLKTAVEWDVIERVPCATKLLPMDEFQSQAGTSNPSLDFMRACTEPARVP